MHQTNWSVRSWLQRSAWTRLQKTLVYFGTKTMTVTTERHLLVQGFIQNFSLGGEHKAWGAAVYMLQSWWSDLNLAKVKWKLRNKEKKKEGRQWLREKLKPVTWQLACHALANWVIQQLIGRAQVLSWQGTSRSPEAATKLGVGWWWNLSALPQPLYETLFIKIL